MITDRLNHIFKAATALIGLALFGLLFIYFVREATMVSKWAHSGSVQNTVVRQTVDSVIVFRRVDTADFSGAPYPQVGDTVLEIADSAATLALFRFYDSSPHAVGVTVTITYLRAGAEQQSLLMLREPETDQYILTVIMQWLRFLIGFGFMGVGLWAFFARPDSAAVRVFALFCSSMTAFIIAGVTVFGDNFAAFDIPFWDTVNVILGLGGVVMGGFWLNLQMLFPRPNKLMQNHPVATYTISYLFPVIGTVMNLTVDNVTIPYVQTILNVGLIGTFLAGFVLLTVRLLKTKEKLERRQARLVLWGSGLGLITLLILVLVAQFFGDWFGAAPMRPLLLVTISFLFLLLTPLSFAYAFGKYRLLEVQGKIRRGTRYVLLLLVVGLAYGAGAVLIGDILITQLGITSNVPMLLIALALAMGISPTQKKIRSILERKFYPERRRLREMLEGFLEGPECLCDRETFWSALENRIRIGLSVNAIYPVLAGTNGAHYRLMERDYTPFLNDSLFVHRLELERRTLFVDEMVASDRMQLSDDETNWLNNNRIALVMPLVAQQRLVGFLGIGCKSDDEDYTSEELRILNAFAPQVALASENIRLVEENVGKRRLEEQMAIARTIQQGFLPRSLPVTPGLEVAAGSRFSLEVAGDYYDVITVDDTQTVLAVGDVSGKGAGAALLMANLQASLRTAIGVGVKLSDAVARINDLIHRNTSPEQYITFIVGVFNSATSEFLYVNAGHNSPIIIRANGETELLETGGLILGCLPGVAYEEGVVRMKSGDLIFMYTDGVSEAMNDHDEEFGEDRIRDFIVAHRTLSPPEILSQLEEAVNHFCGREPNEDDSTVLIARRV